MASLTTDKGKLLLDFVYRGTRCREYLGLDDTKDGRAQARHTKLQVEAEIARDALDYPKWFPKSKRAKIFSPPAPMTAEGPPTFEAYARAWLERQRPAWSNAHALNQQSLLKTHILPVFGAKPLTDTAVTLAAIEDFRNRLLKQKLSGVSVNKARALLSAILSRAVRDGLIPANHVLDVKRTREAKTVVDPMTFDEVKRLLTKGLAHDPEMQRFYTVAIFTGLRTNELLGLQWKDVDVASATPTASIRAGFTKLDRLHVPKTEGSERVIDLRPQAVKALKAQQAATKLKTEFVFASQTGSALDRDNLANRVWYPALKRAGLKARKPYQCRHTFATLALSAGEEIGWVAKMLGHVDTAMVIKHYYRFVQNTTRKDGSALDKAAQAAGL